MYHLFNTRNYTLPGLCAHGRNCPAGKFCVFAFCWQILWRFFDRRRPNEASVPISRKMMHEYQQHFHNQPLLSLPYPPKWMKTSCTARFGFGGKLITILNPMPNQGFVDVFQVVTEPSVFEQAAELQRVLNGEQPVDELCGRRVSQAKDETESIIWQCLQVRNVWNELFESKSKGRFRFRLMFSVKLVIDTSKSLEAPSRCMRWPKK